MKIIYFDSNREAATHALEVLDQKWGSKYYFAIKSCLEIRMN